MCAKVSTKEKILKTSLHLFNAEQCSQVSLRQIAAELYMSDGNLRYHFATKEAIVLTIFDEMSQEMNRVINVFGRNSLFDLESGIEQIYRIMLHYRFFFDEPIFMKKTFPAYATLIEQLEYSRRQIFLELMDELKVSGELSTKFSKEQHDALLEQLFILTDNWILKVPKEAPEKEKSQKLEYYKDLAFKLFIPYKSPEQD